MTNGNDSAKTKHLDSTAAAIKRFILENNSELIDALLADLPASSRLDSVPATVDGGLWFETTDTAPIIKFKQGGSTFYLYTNQLVSPNLSLSSAAVTVTSGASQSVTVSHSGDGTITLSNPNPTALSATYNSADKTIALTSNVTTGSANVNLGVALSESGQYAADSKSISVNCSTQPLDPQLTLSTYTTNISNRGESATVTVSYLGTGTISVQSSSTDAIIASYNSNTKTITLSNQVAVMDTSATITVSLSASPGYASATATITNVSADTSIK